MPLYEYICVECNHHFDKKLSIDDRRLPESEPCPSCGKVSVHKNDGNAIPHTYGIGAECRNNAGGFKDLLKHIHKNNRQSKMDL